MGWLDLLGLGALDQDPLGGLAHGQGLQRMGEQPTKMFFFFSLTDKREPFSIQKKRDLQGSGQFSVRDHRLRLHLLVGHLIEHNWVEKLFLFEI